jgi:hypothetical protein
MIGKLLCTAGRHSWEQRVNREAAGKDAVYRVCRRCGTEQRGYGPPSAGQSMGLAGGG